MKKKILFPAILLTLPFFGCLPSNNKQVPTFISPISTLTSTALPDPITVTETALPAPTPTNFPPVSNEARKDVLTSLLQENGDCQLPCILGLTPGISDSTAVNSFMMYFQENSQVSDDLTDNVNVETFTYDTWSGTNLSFYENKVNVSITVEAQVIDDKVERVDFQGQAMGIIEEGSKKLYGDPYYDEILTTFSLSNILKIYGQPDQIIIRPFPDDEGHPSPPAQYTFDFVLFYPKQGFVAEYVAVRAEEGANFVGCPTKSYLAQISSWNPNEPILITEAIKYFSNLDGVYEENIGEYKQLQDVTSLTLTDFHNMFTMPSSNGCVQTPKEFWSSAIQ